MNLILFGFKGSGKTHFGKLLASELSLSFIDTDGLLGPNVKQLYIELGETAFRAKETQVIGSLKTTKDSIIALGGGAVLNPKNVTLLHSIGKLVYLKASCSLLESRLTSPPAFIETSFSNTYLERLPIYESIEAHCIDTDLLSETQILNELKAIYGI